MTRFNRRSGWTDGALWHMTRLMAGGFLLVAGVLKFHDLIYRLDLDGLPLAGQFAFASLEILLAVWVLVVGGGLGMRRVLVCLWVVFVLVTGWKSLAGEKSCGCFGSLTVDPRVTLVLDLTVLGLLACCTVRALPRMPMSGSMLRRRLALITAVGLIGSVAVWTGWVRLHAVRQPGLDRAGDFVVIDPSRWVGTRLPSEAAACESQSIANGKWLVFFHRHDCEDCRASMPVYLAAFTDGVNARGYRLALVEVPPLRTLDGAREQTNDGVLRCTLGVDGQVFMRTPVVLQIRDGVVRAVFEGLDVRDLSKVMTE